MERRPEKHTQACIKKKDIFAIGLNMAFRERSQVNFAQKKLENQRKTESAFFF